MSDQPIVHVVDDDPDVRDALDNLLNFAGFEVRLYDNAETFLGSVDAGRPGCAILDVRMPGMSGILLQQRLQDLAIHLPLIFFTAYGEVSQAVQALKQGAVDFLEKPVDNPVLLESVRKALAVDAERRRREERHQRQCERLARLTPKERKVFDELVSGRSRNEIAQRLGLKKPTIETHRRNIMEKLQARHLTDLIRLARQASGL